MSTVAAVHTDTKNGAAATVAAPLGKAIEYLTPHDVEIVKDPADPLYDPRGEDALDPSDVADVRLNGILQAIEYVKRTDKDGKVHRIVVFGRHRARWLAAANAERKLAGLPPHPLPAVECDKSPSELFGHVLSENAHRVDLNPMQKARAVLRATKAPISMNPKEIAIRMRCEPGTINRQILLATKAIPELQDAVERRLIAVEPAWDMATLPHAEQKKILLEALGDAEKAGAGVDAKKIRKIASKSAKAKAKKAKGSKATRLSAGDLNALAEDIEVVVTQLKAAGENQEDMEIYLAMLDVIHTCQGADEGKYVALVRDLAEEAAEEEEKAAAPKGKGK